MSTNSPLQATGDNRRESWHWQYNIVLDWYYPRIGDTAFVLYTLLCRMGGESRESFPSLLTMAARLGKSDRTIQTALRVLERYRLVAVTKRMAEVDGHPRQTSNLYTVLQPEMHPDDEMFGPAPVAPKAAPAPVAPVMQPEEMALQKDHATRAVPQAAADAAEAARPLPLTPPPDTMPVDAQFVAFCRANGIRDPAGTIANFLAAMRKTGARRNDWSEALMAWCRNQQARAAQPNGAQHGRPRESNYGGSSGYGGANRYGRGGSGRGGYGQQPPEPPCAPPASRPGNTSGEDVIREMQQLKRQAGPTGQERRF